MKSVFLFILEEGAMSSKEAQPWSSRLSSASHCAAGRSWMWRGSESFEALVPSGRPNRWFPRTHVFCLSCNLNFNELPTWKNLEISCRSPDFWLLKNLSNHVGHRFLEGLGGWNWVEAAASSDWMRSPVCRFFTPSCFTNLCYFPSRQQPWSLL